MKNLSQLVRLVFGFSLLAFFLPHSALAAIAFDSASSDNGNGNSPQYFSTSVTATSSSNLLYINIEENGLSSTQCTGVSANGVAATKIDGINVGGVNFGYASNWYVMGVGGKITLTWTGCRANQTNSGWALYTGVKGINQPDAHLTNSAVASSLTTTTTTSADKSWVISSAYNVSGAMATSSGITSRYIAYGIIGLGDSNGPISPAGSYSMTWTANTGTWGILQASFAPAEPIAFNAASADNGNGNSPQYFTASVVATSSTNLLYINIEENGFSTLSCTSVSANGITATQIDGINIGGTNFGYASNWYVMGVGGKITLTWTGCRLSNTNSGWALYTGVKGINQPDAHLTNSAVASSITSTTTTSADKSWVISSAYNVSGAMAASSGITSRYIVSGIIGLGDSDGPISPAGSYPMTWTANTGTWGVLQASFSPY